MIDGSDRWCSGWCQRWHGKFWRRLFAGRCPGRQRADFRIAGGCRREEGGGKIVVPGLTTDTDDGGGPFNELAMPYGAAARGGTEQWPVIGRRHSCVDSGGPERVSP